MKSIRRAISKQSGFTLVELMITMLILGILVTIVVLTMSYSRSRAQEAACKANLRTIFEAISVYQSVHESQYPPDLDTLLGDPLDRINKPEYIKPSFTWMCPSGDLGTTSGDYRTYYRAATGHTSCPRASHNP